MELISNRCGTICWVFALNLLQHSIGEFVRKCRRHLSDKSLIMRLSSNFHTGIGHLINQDVSANVLWNPEQFGKRPKLRSTEDICTTKDCLALASMMLKNQDSSVDPCEDFYEYACGGFKDYTPLPDDETKFGVFSGMINRLQRQLKTLLEEPRSPTELKSSRMAKTFYESCTDEEKIDEMGPGPLIRFGERFGQWPVLVEKWDQAAYKWEVQAGTLSRYGNVRPIISVSIDFDLKDSRNKLIYVDQPDLALKSREYYIEKKHSEKIEAHLEYMVKTAMAFGAEEERAREQMGQVLHFEKLIAKITVPETERRDHSKRFHPMTVQELKSEVSFVDWEALLNASFSNTTIQITDEEKIVIGGLPYLKSLGDVIHRTSQRTIANFLMWDLFSRYKDYLSKKFRDLSRKLSELLKGSATKDKPKWMDCITLTKKLLRWPLSRLYIEKHFSLYAKQEMDVMVKNIREAMQRGIKKNEWMDGETKREALLKLAQLEEKIGFPDSITNETKILEGLDQVTLSKDSLFTNVVSLTQHMVRQGLEAVRKKVDKKSWDVSPAEINAFYHFTKHQIIFPAAILQPPLFSPEVPRYTNYGRVGMFIGHEVTHGYDNIGRQYDGKGNVKEWWQPRALKQFTDKAQCFARQYSNITEPISKLKLNGNLTLGENIADCGGVKMAHDAYSRWRRRGGGRSEAGLPGFLDMTPDQLFFLSFASTWCEIVRPGAIQHIVIVSPHGLNKYRVNLPLQNYPAFSKAFGCKVGTPMNPFERCKVW